MHDMHCHALVDAHLPNDVGTDANLSPVRLSWLIGPYGFNLALYFFKRRSQHLAQLHCHTIARVVVECLVDVPFLS